MHWGVNLYVKGMLTKRQRVFYYVLVGAVAQNTAQTAKEKHVWSVGNQKIQGRYSGKNQYHILETPPSYYDLWRVENGKIAEHWDVMETIADKESWQNTNGKF